MNSVVDSNYSIQNIEKILDIIWLIGDKIIIEKAIAKSSVIKFDADNTNIMYFDSLDNIITTMSEYFISISYAIVNSNQTSGRKAIEEIKDYIDLHYCEEISLKHLSKVTNMNSAYLSDIFKEILGMNFVDYLTNKRIQKSCEYLKSYSMAINQIASWWVMRMKGILVQFSKGQSD